MKALEQVNWHFVYFKKGIFKFTRIWQLNIFLKFTISNSLKNFL